MGIKKVLRIDVIELKRDAAGDCVSHKRLCKVVSTGDNAFKRVNTQLGIVMTGNLFQYLARGCRAIPPRCQNGHHQTRQAIRWYCNPPKTSWLRQA
jgi:hypothetical protein